MRLISYLDEGAEPRLGLERADRFLPASDLLPDGPTTMAALLEGGEELLATLRRAEERATDQITSEGRPQGEATLAPPVPRPGKVVAVGLNYHGHAEEQGRPLPAGPVLFAKFTTALLGHGGEIRWDPRLTEQVDYEAELAVVIGRRARHVPLAAAIDHVLGYTCLNDVTARDLQSRDRQFVRAKSLDTFCPLGPTLVTRDEIADPGRLAISAWVNGERRQSATTAELIFGVAELVAFCSAAFTLEPGDIIATGTPAGVGVFRDPPVFLADNDEVAVEIEGIGRLVNRCRTVGPT